MTPDQTMQPSRARRFILRARRYALDTHVEVSRDHTRLGVGRLIDISAGGVAFTSYTKLQVGDSVLLEIGGLGALHTDIVRSFGTHSYGGRFALEAFEKRRFEKKIGELGTPVEEYA